MRQPKDQQPNMSTGILIVVLIWALPALAGSFLTCCEQYKSGTDKFWTWGAAGGVLVDPGVFEEQLHVHVEDAGSAVAALDVPPDPEEPLGDPAQPDGSPRDCWCSCCCCSCCSIRERGRSWGECAGSGRTVVSGS